MADFITTLKGMPQMQGVNAETIEGLVDDAILALYGVHRWPFLKKVNQTLTWTASAATVSFPGLSRVSTIRYPDTSTKYRPLTMLSDADFARYKYSNSGITKTYVWRDAGLDGNDLTLEIYKPPSSATSLRADYYEMPGSADIDILPAYFRRLVRLMVLSEIPNSGVSVVNIDYQTREAIARSEDEAGGELEYARPDDFIEAVMQDVNNPS